MTADLLEVVSNRTTSDRQEIDWENDWMMKILRKHLVRTDGMELEPRDLICGMYSQLGNIDASFRSNPPTLDALIYDKANSESFERTLDDLEDKCNQDPSRYEEKCISAAEALLFMDVALSVNEIGAFYTQQFRQTEETVGEVLMKPEMCGEGWKHGQKYVKGRQGWREEAKASPVLRISV
ncbi:hypothetical protein NW755_006482 [Fusarium falciforme]|uniref:Uncharacterized protein n=1 Tax=Fusarium falciforme TaxID=195108 RepID=A0A9W8R9F9_9HYPO|nr:hypothetical protein NW755_006482 [Fusarium falciforme]KAJ4255205.1 hypothetical protein NW757_004714 [Fusarium falciforme]